MHAKNVFIGNYKYEAVKSIGVNVIREQCSETAVSLKINATRKKKKEREKDFSYVN